MLLICGIVGVAVVLMVRDMNRRLETVVIDLTMGVAQVASAAGQVAGASQSLAQGASGIAIASQAKLGATNLLLQQTVVAVEASNAQNGRIPKIIKVEAARAGEAGMGFAVVADEVRNLA